MALGLALVASRSDAVSLDPAPIKITSVFGEVLLRSAAGESRLAKMHGPVGKGDIVRTGDNARIELTFPDQTIARLGGQTTFAVKEGARELALEEGVILLQVPKKGKGATLRAGAFAAAVSGGTALLEFRPGVYKFVVLEGTSRLYRPGHFGDSVLVRPGQLVMGDPGQPVSDPVDFEVARFLRTCRFITEFSPLPRENTILLASEKQQHQKSRKKLIGTNLVIFGGGSVVSVMPPELKGAPIEVASATGGASSSPGESLADDLGTVEALPSRPSAERPVVNAIAHSTEEAATH